MSSAPSMPSDANQAGRQFQRTQPQAVLPGLYDEIVIQPGHLPSRAEATSRPLRADAAGQTREWVCRASAPRRRLSRTPTPISAAAASSNHSTSTPVKAGGPPLGPVAGELTGAPPMKIWIGSAGQPD